MHTAIFIFKCSLFFFFPLSFLFLLITQKSHSNPHKTEFQFRVKMKYAKL